MAATATKFVWERLRQLNRIPGAYPLYQAVMRAALRDGAVVVIRRGPLRGCRWRHYRIYQAWMALGMYEPHVAQLIQSELKPGDVFYDVGANAGYYTLLAGRIVGPTGRVIAFDPHPRNVSTIQEQIDLNFLADTCHVEAAAVSDRLGAQTFVLSSTNANSHLAGVDPRSNSDAQEQTVEVTLATLDDCALRHPRPSLIKIDVEGAEVLVLHGAKHLLQMSDAPRWLVSTHSADLQRECEAIFRRNSYTFRHLEGFQQMIYALPPGLPES